MTSGGRSRSHSIGANFESVVADCLQLAANRGILTWNRVGTQARAKRGPGGTLRFAPGPSMPDFVGCLRGGHLFLFDAKTVSAKSWHLPARQHHQYETLARYASVGALAFFLVHQTDELRRTLSTWMLRVVVPFRGTRLPAFHFPELRLGRPLEAFDYPLGVHACSMEFGRPDYFIEVMRSWL